MEENTQAPSRLYPMIVLTTLFFMWGFITCMNDILVPYLKDVFNLNHTRAMLVQFSFFGAYFIGSVIYFIFSSAFGDPISRMGYKNGIIAGLLLSATGTMLFYPAAAFVSYGFFLAALFVLGLGFTLLQIAANPYVAILGKPETASGRLNLAQGFNSFGTTIAPLIGGFLIFKYFAGAHVTGADSVKVPYLIFTLLFLILAIFIRLSKLPVLTGGEKPERGMKVFRFPQLTLGIFAIFLYVGAEVSIGSIMISFLGLKEIAGLPKEAASTYVAFYWGGLMIGRFMGAISLSSLKGWFRPALMFCIPALAFLVVWYLSGIDTALIFGLLMLINYLVFMAGKSLPARTLFLFSIMAAALLIAALLNDGPVAMWSIIGIGLFNSIMWSNIFTLAITGLGKYTGQGSSLLVMAILGGALLPVIQGGVADHAGVHLSFIVPVFSYIYIAFYGLRGYKPGKKSSS